MKYRINLGTRVPFLEDTTIDTFENVLNNPYSLEYKSIHEYDEYSLVTFGVDSRGAYLLTECQQKNCAINRFEEVLRQLLKSVGYPINQDQAKRMIKNKGISYEQRTRFST